MLLLLPPSETKRPGGREGTRLDLAALSLPELTRHRRAVLASLTELVKDPDGARRALRLGPTQAAEVAVSRRVRRSPVMPALDRFDGVLYDALDAPTLSSAARAAAGDHVLIGSALFGLVGALDPIPAYRLSPDSRLPGLRLAAHWRPALEPALASRQGLVLDLRSEAYREHGPAPLRARSLFVRVVTEGADGRRRALNHFNKSGKGRFTRDVLEAGAGFTTVGELREWAAATGWRLEPGAEGELDLIV